MFDLKKSLVILLIGIMMFLPSCGKKVKKESITPAKPNCTVSASYNSQEYSAKLGYSDMGVMTVEMLAPFSGVVFTVDDSGCQLAYDGMKLGYTTQQAQRFCPFVRLYLFLKTVCYTVPEKARASGEEYVLQYRTPELSCTARSDKKDGTLREIEAENIKFIFNK